MESVESCAVLFVRSGVDLARVVWSVNTLLSIRRRARSTPLDLVGIVVDPSFEANLVQLSRCGARASGGEVILRESVGIAGIWSLCRFDVRSCEGPRCTHDRRRDVVARLLRSGRSNADETVPRRVLLPVFSLTEACGPVDLAVEDLQRRLPTLEVGSECFAVDPQRGGIVRLSAPIARDLAS